MNKNLKKTMLSLLVAVLGVMTVFTACGPQDLTGLVEELNSQCPVKQDPMTIESAAIQDNNVVVTFSVPADQIPISMLNAVPGAAETMKAQLLPTLGDGDFKDIAEMCVQENKGFTFVLQNTKDGDKFSLAYTPEDMKQALGK